MTPLNERQYTSYSLTCWKRRGMRSYRWKRRAEGGEIQRRESRATAVGREGSDNYAGDEMVTKVVPVRKCRSANWHRFCAR